MDFIISYYLYNQIKNKELSEIKKIKNGDTQHPKPQYYTMETKMKKEGNKKKTHYYTMKMKMKTQQTIKEDRRLTFKTCERCGQDPYLCQCKNNIKFNP